MLICESFWAQIEVNKTSFKSYSSLLWLLIIAFFLLPTSSFALENNTGMLSQINIGIGSWIPAVKNATWWVFWTLVLIDWGWTFGKMALSGFEIGEFLATLIKKVIVVGIIMFLFDVDIWLFDYIQDSFSILSYQASGVFVTPDSITDGAYRIFHTIWKSASFWDGVPQALVTLIIGVLILLAFLFMAIDLMIVYIKFYLMQVVIYFALALGGMEHFRQTAFNPILTAVKVGIELFVIQALMGFAIIHIEKITTQLSNNTSIELITQALIISMIFAVITKLVPTVIEAVMSGGIGDTHMTSSGFKQVAAMTAGAVVGATASGVANTVGVTRAMQAAMDLHEAKGGDSSFMGTAKGMAKEMGSAYSDHLKGSFVKGRTSNSMANVMEEKFKNMNNSKDPNMSGTISGVKK
ncbi:MAG: P-type conjugative transfer protein TrbL [Arcobacter butzleri]|nr:P-type conjugative transfer protein TrbL [Aliarcobacter butzleri]